MTARAGQRPSEATVLLNIARTAGIDLWHDPQFRPWASVTSSGHLENWPVESRAFKRWLGSRFYAKAQNAPSAQGLHDAMSVLAGEAVFAGAEYPVCTRVAGQSGCIYLDLANADWEAAEIGPSGWRVISKPPVKFRRSPGMLPLPHPVTGGSINDLRPMLNLNDDKAWVLLQAWLVAAVRDTGPYPVLILHGEQGSAKSTTARVLRSLVDPNTGSLRSQPGDTRDLMIAAANGWIMNFDNLSFLPPWLSDSLCRLATGGGYATRELYTDTDEVLFDAQRPIVLNGIEELATRGDLLDRSIVMYLPAISHNQRCSEAIFWSRFQASRPRILGCLLDAASFALDNVTGVQLPEMPRMADFAEWACAAAPKLGFTQQQFIDAYAGNKDEGLSITLEASPIFEPLQSLIRVKGGSIEATTTELLNDLDRYIPIGARRPQGWPGNGRTLSSMLRRLAPGLRAIGVAVSFRRESSGKRLVSIKQVVQTSVGCVDSVAASPEGVDAGPGPAMQSVTADEVKAPTVSVTASLGDAIDAADAKSAVHATLPWDEFLEVDEDERWEEDDLDESHID